MQACVTGVRSRALFCIHVNPAFLGLCFVYNCGRILLVCEGAISILNERLGTDMSCWTFAKLWKHPEVAVETVEGQRVLVGRGIPTEQPVLEGEPMVLPSRYEAHRRIEPKLSERILYTHSFAFASIETEEQALAFANHYGLLGLNVTPSSKVERGPLWEVRLSDGLEPPEFGPEPLSEWLRWSKKLRSYLRMAQQTTPYAPGPIVVALGALVAVELEDEPRLRVFHGRMVIAHQRLISSLLTKAALDLSGLASAPVSCASKECGRWFVPIHPETRYCSETCRRREQNRRQYERRKRGSRVRDGGLSVHQFVHQSAKPESAGRRGKQ